MLNPHIALLLADGDEPSVFEVMGLVALGLFLLGFLVLFLRYAKLYIQSVLSGAGVGLFDMLAMSLRKVDPAVIVVGRINLVQSRINGITANDLEAHYLAGGNVPRVVSAIISSNRAGLDLDYKAATGIDLAGRDVLDAVNTSVTPKVIDCPDPAKGKSEVAAVAKDGIQVLAKARVTVRTNIARLVGGAGEETIIARVGEGIVSTIGSMDTHKHVLENPDEISKTVLNRASTRARPSRSSPLISRTSTSAATSALACRQTRRRPTSAWPRPSPRSGGPWPSRPSRSSRPVFRRTAPRSSRPRPRCPWPWPRPSSLATSGSWTCSA